jgi:hypothetical protein
MRDRAADPSTKIFVCQYLQKYFAEVFADVIPVWLMYLFIFAIFATAIDTKGQKDKMACAPRSHKVQHRTAGEWLKGGAPI